MSDSRTPVKELTPSSHEPTDTDLIDGIFTGAPLDSKTPEKELTPSSHEPTDTDLIDGIFTVTPLDSKPSEKELTPPSHEPTESDLIAGIFNGTHLNLELESVADDAAAHIDDEKPQIEAAMMGDVDIIGTPIEPQSESQPRRSRGGAKSGLELAVIEASPKTPDWLPQGWLMENRVRGTGVTAGMKDRYFYDPVSGRQFRSKKEVFCFLETGSSGRLRGRSRKSNSDANISDLESSGCDGQNGSNSKRKRSNASSFDLKNRPAKVRWVLTDSSIGLWTPFIGDKSLPGSSKQE